MMVRRLLGLRTKQHSISKSRFWDEQRQPPSNSQDVYHRGPPHIGTASLPALVCLGKHVACSVKDIIRSESLSERWHRIFAIRHLVHDLVDVVHAVRLEHILFQRLFNPNGIVPTSMTRRASP